MENPNILFEQRAGDGYFTLNWSALKKTDKYYVVQSVPAMSGIYELYRMDEEKKLNLLTVSIAWYGGLRSQIRQAIEPSIKTNPEERALLEDAVLYSRYSLCNNLENLQDVLWFLHATYFPENLKVSPTGRFKKIYVKESAPDRIRWV